MSTTIFSKKAVKRDKKIGDDLMITPEEILVVKTNTDSGVRRPEFKFLVCYLLAV